MTDHSKHAREPGASGTAVQGPGAIEHTGHSAAHHERPVASDTAVAPDAPHGGAHLGHAAHTGGHAGHDEHAGHSEAMFRRPFWIALLLTIPVLVYVQLIQELLGYTAPSLPGSAWLG